VDLCEAAFYTVCILLLIIMNVHPTDNATTRVCLPNCLANKQLMNMNSLTMWRTIQYLNQFKALCIQPDVVKSEVKFIMVHEMV